MTDPYVQRMHSDMNTWLILERQLCKCEDVCDCGWDDLEEDDDLSSFGPPRPQGQEWKL